VNPYFNEEVTWQRLKDTQREAENRRLLRVAQSLLVVAWALAKRLWLRSRPDPQPVSAQAADDRPSASDAA